MIIDAHAHLSTTGYGNIDVLLAQMDYAGIDKAVLIPGGMIDVRQMTKIITGEIRVQPTAIPNALIEQTIAAHPGRFYGFVCVNPHEGEKAVDTLREYIGKGFSGLKLAPMVHQFSLTSPVVKELAAEAGALGVPVYTHTVFSPAASTARIGLLADAFPQTTFIIGHMGFGPADTTAVELAKTKANVFLETSGGSYLIIKQAIEEAGADKVIFGSEFPMYHPKSELEKIVAVQSEQQGAILAGNMLKLLHPSHNRPAAAVDLPEHPENAAPSPPVQSAGRMDQIVLFP